MLDSIQMDQLHNLIKRVIFEEAPNSDMERAAEEWWSDEGNAWRMVARFVAEISPSVLRQGCHARWARLAKQEAPLFYYELIKPAQRLEKGQDLTAFVKL